MIELRRSEQRGHANHGWLDAFHTFSFAGYRDPEHMGFRALRVINEDRIAPNGGFPTHGHQDMEILTYVVEGSLEHKDSLGNGSQIRAGEFQRMSAGRGVMHSEFNGSAAEPVHLLQIWIKPAERGIEPGYEQRRFDDRANRLRVVASPSGREGSLTIHQDAEVFSALFEPGQRATHTLAEGRHAWVQVISGSLSVNGHALTAGDGAALSVEAAVELQTHDQGAEVLVFDLN